MKTKCRNGKDKWFLIRYSQSEPKKKKKKKKKKKIKRQAKNVFPKRRKESRNLQRFSSCSADQVLWQTEKWTNSQPDIRPWQKLCLPILKEDTILWISSLILSNVIFPNADVSRHVRKRYFRHVRPVKIQISLRIRAAWSESTLGVFCIAKGANCLDADNEDSDQTARMYRLIWVFLGRLCQKVRFLTLRHMSPDPEGVRGWKHNYVGGRSYLEWYSFQILMMDFVHIWHGCIKRLACCVKFSADDILNMFFFLIFLQ